MPKIIGHRGCKGEQPENTLIGIKKAIEAGVDGVEIDVHLTKDNKLVVIHDDTVDRTTNGQGKVLDFTLEEIRKLDAGKGEKIPTLQEVIDIIKQSGIELVIEIKCENAEQDVAEAIEKNNIIEKTIVKSFNHRIVKKVKEINDKIKTACLLAGLPVHAYRLLEDAKADVLSINFRTVDKELIDECHEHGCHVFIWNIDDKEELKKFIDMGADYIGTNFPSKIIP